MHYPCQTRERQAQAQKVLLESILAGNPKQELNRESESLVEQLIRRADIANRPMHSLEATPTSPEISI